YDASHARSLRTRLGVNVGQGSYHGYNATTPENSEVTDVNGINENYSLFTEWTWSNTLNWTRTMSQHSLAVLLGQEASKNTNRLEVGSCAKLLNTLVDSRYIQDALCDPTTKNVTSSGGRSALLSLFGKADYNYGERYYLSLTVRRDGSSRFGPDDRWGTFPAVGAGWRLSRESFFPKGTFSNAMLRFGWGVTGNQQIPSGRIVSQFGGDRGDTFYDIGGTSTTIRPGFKQTAIGNTGMEVSRGYHDTSGTGGLWSVTFNGSHYTNKTLQIDDLGTQSFTGPISLREQNPVINMIGEPIGAFYGLVADGYYKDSLDAAPFWDDGARPGRIKFKDLNGDGTITGADRAITGSPHPDLTG